MVIKIHFDGAVSKSQLGCDMGIGVAVFVDDEYREDLSKFVPVRGSHNSSSNVAEWIGCVEAFIVAYDLCQKFDKFDKIEVYSDSQLITYQYNDLYQIKKDNFQEYYRQAKIWAKKAGLQNLKVQWVRRELNKEADKLSKKAIKTFSSATVEIN